MRGRFIIFFCVLIAALYNGGITVRAMELRVFEITGEACEACGACGACESYIWRARLVDTDGALTPEERAFRVYEAFFAEAYYCVPENTRVLSVKIEDAHLSVNVSGDVLRYGGNAFERALVEQLLMTARGLPGIEYFTLMTNGRVQTLTEGRVIDGIALR